MEDVWHLTLSYVYQWNLYLESPSAYINIALLLAAEHMPEYTDR
jgi:hypothetical protein